MRFPYLEFEGRHFPIINIKIKGSEWVEFRAFVDSGAGYSVFRASAAEMLGLDIEKGSREFVKIGDGSFIEVFIFKLHVSIADKEFEAKIGFSAAWESDSISSEGRIFSRNSKSVLTKPNGVLNLRPSEIKKSLPDMVITPSEAIDMLLSKHA